MTKLRVSISISVVGLILGVSVWPAATALAGSGASVTSPSSEAQVSGTVSVNGSAGAGADGLRDVQLLIGGTVVDSSGPFDCPNNRTGANLSYGWDTNLAFSGGLAANRQETIKVTAAPCAGQSVEDSVTVYVNNPPRDPSGVSASANGQKVTVTWNANPEPDIEAYEVARDGMTTKVTGASFSEEVAPGTYTYRVTAIRRGTHGALRSSAVSSNSLTVEEPPPPPPDPSDDPSPSDPGSGGTSSPKDGSGGGSIGIGDPGDGGGTGGSSGGGGTIQIPGGTIAIPQETETFDLADLPKLNIDLPFSLAALPPLPFGLPPLDPPDPPATDDDGGGWAVFEDPVAFEPPGTDDAEGPANFFSGQLNIAARSPDRLLPPDQVRWLLVGLLALLLAGGFWLLDLRLQLLGVRSQMEARDQT